MPVFRKKSEESPTYGDFHCRTPFFRETLHFSLTVRHLHSQEVPLDENPYRCRPEATRFRFKAHIRWQCICTHTARGGVRAIIRVSKDTKNTKISVHKLIFIPNIWSLAKVYVPLQRNDRNYGC